MFDKSTYIAQWKRDNVVKVHEQWRRQGIRRKERRRTDVIFAEKERARFKEWRDANIDKAHTKGIIDNFLRGTILQRKDLPDDLIQLLMARSILREKLIKKEKVMSTKQLKSNGTKVTIETIDDIKVKHDAASLANKMWTVIEQVESRDMPPRVGNVICQAAGNIIAIARLRLETLKMGGDGNPVDLLDDNGLSR